MKDPVKLGSVWRFSGKTERFVVVDKTFGGDIILIKYRHRKSHLKYYSHNQKRVPIGEFLGNYTKATKP